MKGNKGITLIALVVTIIVLLILAGVSIAMLSGENGILQKASDAAVETRISSAKEIAVIDLADVIAEYYYQRYVVVNNTVVEESLQGFIQDNWATSDATQYSVTSGSVTITPKLADGTEVTGTVQADGTILWSYPAAD